MLNLNLFRQLMRTLITASKYSVQFIQDTGNLQVNESYYSSKHFSLNKSNKGVKSSSCRYQDKQEILSLLLKSLNKQSKIPTYSVTLNFSNIMDPQQQRLLAQILQQPEQKMLGLKEYQMMTQEHLQHQILNPEIMANNFWFASLAMQRNGTTYPNLLQNLNSPAISPAPNCNRHQISTALNSIMNTNYLPAVVPSTMPLLNIPSVKEGQFDELASFLVIDELQKIADSAKQTWQNLMRHQEIRLPQLTTEHGLHQQVPSVSPFMKRRISESLQQQQQAVESAQTTVIKRAKVIVIEQKDPETIPCCYSSPFLCQIC